MGCYGQASPNVIFVNESVLFRSKIKWLRSLWRSHQFEGGASGAEVRVTFDDVIAF